MARCFREIEDQAGRDVALARPSWWTVLSRLEKCSLVVESPLVDVTNDDYRE